ncbi:MAG: PQQ-binding-like beta-propeller repeat protein [Chloroflexi bacterium]|nr:PQQ-binding-like beta-propeller repeat protein [Chloroflexota bacterium]
MEKILARVLTSATVFAWLFSCAVTPPASYSIVAETVVDEWTQHAHDPQRTSYSSEDISGEWQYRWQWNGADSSGRGVLDWMPMKTLVQPITGDGRVYVVAGWSGGAADSVFALAQSDGRALWRVAPGGELSSTPAFRGGYLFVASENGTLYKLDASNGSIVDRFAADSVLRTPPLMVDNRIYVTSMNGTLYAISTDMMSELWSYPAGAQAATMPAYSVSRDLIVFCDRELYVHAVDSSGNRLWRVKPTSRQPFYGHPTSEDPDADEAAFDYGWPVVADSQGVVFVRLRLNWSTLWGGPGNGGSYPTTNSAIRQFLESNPDQQTLFALDLDDGAHAFTPAVGNNACEGDESLQLVMGPQPAIRTLSNGKQVAYIAWRNGQVNPASDGRWDTTMGEMVLDAATVTGYQAGDLRFVSTHSMPTDETGTITGAGDFIFHGHWLVMTSSYLGDRAGGGTYVDGIGEVGPYVIWAQAGDRGCSFNALTRWCRDLYTEIDTRNFGSGHYVLYGQPERWLTSDDPYAFNYTPYVVVSDGMLFVKSIDGAILALEAVQSGPEGPDLSASTKTASTRAPQEGDVVTYTIVLRNSGGPIGVRTTMTDVIPSGLSYIAGSARASIGTPVYAAGAIHWSSVLSTTPIATITYGVTVIADGPSPIQNTVLINSRPFPFLTRSSTVIVNGLSAYVPVILRAR